MVGAGQERRGEEKRKERERKRKKEKKKSQFLPRETPGKLVWLGNATVNAPKLLRSPKFSGLNTIKVIVIIIICLYCCRILREMEHRGYEQEAALIEAGTGSGDSYPKAKPQ